MMRNRHKDFLQNKVRVMGFNTTFNNISVILWRSVLLVEETDYIEKTTDLSQATDKLYHIMLYTLSGAVLKLTTLVVIGTDCIGSCKSKDHDSPFFATNKMN